MIQLGVSCALSPDGHPDTETFKINAGGSSLGRVASVMTTATAMVLSQLTGEPYPTFVELLVNKVTEINNSKKDEADNHDDTGKDTEPA